MLPAGHWVTLRVHRYWRQAMVVWWSKSKVARDCWQWPHLGRSSKLGYDLPKQLARQHGFHIYLVRRLYCCLDMACCAIECPHLGLYPSR